MDRAERVFRVHPRVRFRRLYDEAVVIHQDQAETLVLNDAGVTFLECCDGERDLAAVIEAMRAQLAVDAPTLAGDLQPFVAELEALGIIEAVAGEGR